MVSIFLISFLFTALFHSTFDAHATLPRGAVASIAVYPSSKDVFISDELFDEPFVKPFDVDVRVNDVTGMAEWRYELFWNKSALQFINDVVHTPDVWNSSNTIEHRRIANDYNSTHGRYVRGEACRPGDPSFNGSMSVTTLTFKALAAGATSLKLIGTKLHNSAGEPIEHTDTDGHIRVQVLTIDHAVDVYVDPPMIVDPPEYFNVSVKVDNLTDLAGVSWQLTWDPTLLKAVGMTEVMFHEVAPQAEWENIWRLKHTIDNELGKAKYAYSWMDLDRAKAGGYSSISGNHTMATISFQVLAVGNCTLQLTRDWTKLADSNAFPIAHDVIDGFFSSVALPPSLPPPIDSSQVLIYVDPPILRNESLVVNDTFTVDVKMDSLSNHFPMIQGAFHLSWNSTLLICIGVTEVMFHEAWPESEWQNINWELWVTSDAVSATANPQNIPAAEVGEHLIPSGNHTLATITFRVNNTGSCSLHLFDCLPLECPSFRIGSRQLIYRTVDGYFANADSERTGQEGTSYQEGSSVPHAPTINPEIGFLAIPIVTLAILIADDIRGRRRNRVIDRPKPQP